MTNPCNCLYSCADKNLSVPRKGCRKTLMVSDYRSTYDARTNQHLHRNSDDSFNQFGIMSLTPHPHAHVPSQETTRCEPIHDAYSSMSSSYSCSDSYSSSDSSSSSNTSASDSY